MFKRHTRLYAVAGAVLTAGTLALSGVAIASAAPVGHSRPAASGVEHFQFITTSASSKSASAVGSGLFGDGGVIRPLNTNPSTVVLSRGSFKVVHSKASGTPKVNPRTCVFTLNGTGTYRISHGTGKYAGISGHGSYRLSIIAVFPRSGGKCAHHAAPIAFQQVIKASGPVSL